MDNHESDTTATDLAAVLQQLAAVLDTIPADHEHAPTPCTEHDVSGLRSHVLGWLTAFTDGFADPGGLCSDPDKVTVQGTGADQVRALADRLDTALQGTRPEQLMIGDSGMPTGMALDMIRWEYQVHGWDLATATDRPWSPAERGLRASLEFAPTMLTDDYQGEGKAFGPRVEVAPDATPLDRLLGLSGRDPHWAA